MDEVVQYQNDMNRLNFKGFTQMDMNIFMALCSQMKEKHTEEIILSFSKIKKMINYSKKNSVEKFVEDLKRMNKKLMSVNCEIITKSEIIMFVLFPTFKINSREETLTVAVNKDFLWLLNEMNTYTIFELAEFIELKSKYSKNLYRLLKQWRTVGKYTFHNLEQFRELMDVPKSYTNRQLMQDCVNVAIDEIVKSDGSFKDFCFEPVYAKKRGKPLEKLIFTWQAEVPTQKTEISLETKTKNKATKSNQKKSEDNKKSCNKFNNFQGRQYSKDEIDLLEKQLLDANNNITIDNKSKNE